MAAIILYENLRALFYAPYYAAAERGLFAAEGVEVEIRLSPNPEENARRLAAGEVDVAWGGPLRVLRNADRDPAADIVCFAEVVGRDPFFLIGRKPAGGAFDLAALKDLRLAVVSEVPTPWICLQQDLRDRGIDPASLTLVEGRGMAENCAALVRGEVDVVQAFQPYVEQAVLAGATVLHAAASRGPTAYTCFYTSRASIARNRAAYEGMARAVRASVEWVYQAGGAQVADVIRPWFPDLPAAVAAAAIDRYRGLELYNRTGVMPRAGFERLRRSMISAGYIDRGADYDAAVDLSITG
jgi:NitT/TauT family transport system substrate-binding protein